MSPELWRKLLVAPLPQAGRYANQVVRAVTNSSAVGASRDLHPSHASSATGLRSDATDRIASSTLSPRPSASSYNAARSVAAGCNISSTQVSIHSTAKSHLNSFGDRLRMHRLRPTPHASNQSGAPPVEKPQTRLMPLVATPSSTPNVCTDDLEPSTLFGFADIDEEVIDFEPRSSLFPVEFRLPVDDTHAIASTTSAVPNGLAASAVSGCTSSNLHGLCTCAESTLSGIPSCTLSDDLHDMSAESATTMAPCRISSAGVPSLRPRQSSACESRHRSPRSIERSAASDPTHGAHSPTIISLKLSTDAIESGLDSNRGGDSVQKATGPQVEDAIASGLDSDRGGDVKNLVRETLGSQVEDTLASGLDSDRCGDVESLVQELVDSQIAFSTARAAASDFGFPTNRALSTSAIISVRTGVDIGAHSASVCSAEPTTVSGGAAERHFAPTPASAMTTLAAVLSFTSRETGSRCWSLGLHFNNHDSVLGRIFGASCGMQNSADFARSLKDLLLFPHVSVAPSAAVSSQEDLQLYFLHPPCLPRPTSKHSHRMRILRLAFLVVAWRIRLLLPVPTAAVLPSHFACLYLFCDQVFKAAYSHHCCVASSTRKDCSLNAASAAVFVSTT